MPWASEQVLVSILLLPAYPKKANKVHCRNICKIRILAAGRKLY